MKFLRKFTYLHLLAVALLLLGAGCSVVEEAQAFKDVGESFMDNLGAGNYQAAYNLFTPELKEEVGDVQSLQAMIEENAAQPESWSFHSINLSTNESQQQIGSLEGDIKYQDGKEGVVTLELTPVNGQWLLLSFNLSW